MDATKAKKIGLWLFLCVIAVVVIWDVVMQAVFGLSHTVSQAVWDVSIEQPVVTMVISLVFGMILSHLFWSGFADAHRELLKVKKRVEELEVENGQLRKLNAALNGTDKNPRSDADHA